MATLAAKVLAMRNDLISDVRNQIASAIEDSGDDRLDGADITSAGMSLVAEWVADHLIERGWVTEHADAGSDPWGPDTDDDDDTADD